MYVQKRSGDTEIVSFDKVLRRLSLISKGLENVNIYEIAQKVCSRIYDGVKTSELDEFASQICSSSTLKHPDYGLLASRIVVSNHHKNTSPSFSETVNILYGNTNYLGQHAPLVSKDLYDIVQKNKETLNSKIDYSRDYDIDYFGFKTLENAYLLSIRNDVEKAKGRGRGKVIERPQHMFMRVAIGIHGNDIKDVIETYDLMSKKYFVHATPTLFNSGTNRPQCSSCFLLTIDDSISGIYECLKECALISQNAGGIGLSIKNIRCKDSPILGTNGVSSGIVPMARVFNETARYVDQSGRRNGSIALYIEPWHSDIEFFLDMKKNHGVEDERARDLFYALWIPDLFMHRVKNNEKWSLMCPNICKGLTDTFGTEFENLYNDYEKKGMYYKQVNV